VRFLTRQTIVVAFAAVALLYGLFNFPFMPKFKSNLKNIGKQMNLTVEFAADLQKKMSKGGFSPTGEYILSKASSDWKRDIFLKSRLPTQDKLEREIADIATLQESLSYTGFLETQNTRLAIINGREYEEGEKLDENEYVVLRILPDQIMIGEKGKAKKFRVGLTETD
jgi:hypothetical protein